MKLTREATGIYTYRITYDGDSQNALLLATPLR